MDRLKKIVKVLLFPHIAIVVILVPMAIALLVYAMVFTQEQNAVSWIAYVLSAYTLTVVCCRIPAMIRFVNTVKTENKYVVMLLNDAKLRAKLSLYGSLIINTAYAIFQLGLGFYHKSFWFYSLSGYYVSLAVMRFFLLKDIHLGEKKVSKLSELKRYRFCGIILLLMNIALALMVFYMVYWKRGFTHHEITTITLAAYTFGSLAMAIVNVVKYRKYNSAVLSASKGISLASATVSLLTLEVTMLNVYSDNITSDYRTIIVLLTGIAVCLFITGMAIYMIARANKQIKQIKQVNYESKR